MARRTAFAQTLVDIVRREVDAEVERILGALLGAVPRAGEPPVADGEDGAAAADAAPPVRRRRRRRRRRRAAS